MILLEDGETNAEIYPQIGKIENLPLSFVLLSNDSIVYSLIVYERSICIMDFYASNVRMGLWEL